MIYTEQTKHAMRLAYQAHHGQLDQSGMPYIFHPFYLAEQMQDELSTTVALLHDVIEDTPCTIEGLAAEGFPEEVTEALLLLTRNDAETYFDYVRKIKRNPVATTVKLADLNHNSDLSRLDVVNKAALKRTEKYKMAIKLLTEEPIEVVAALIWDNNRFMICQRPASKARGLLWEFVGGKVELGETQQQALVREAQEELAITLSVGDLFMDVVHAYPDITVHLTLFHATIAGGAPQLLEHNDLKWITPAEIRQYEFCPADEEILQKIQQIADAAETQIEFQPQ